MATIKLTIDAKYVQNLIKTDFDLSKICLGIGNEPIYEPYVGGQPSPSPDYPQEIKSAGDGGSVEVKVTGANVLEGTKPGLESTSLGVTFTSGENGVLITGVSTSVSSMTLHKDIISRLPRGIYYLTTKGLSASVVLDFFYVGKITSDQQNQKVLLTKDVEYSLILQIQKSETPNTIVQISLTRAPITAYSPYREQLITIPTPNGLHGIPVASGGNVTIDGQQYIADRVVEKDGAFGIERNTATCVPVLTKTLKETPDIKGRFLQESAFKKNFTSLYEPLVNIGYGKSWASGVNIADKWVFGVNKMNLYIKPPKYLNYSSEDVLNALKDLNIKVYGALSVSIFEPLPEDIQSKLRALSTNYPVTNISVTSDQLDGYTVFNYQISMANGWNYVKQQLGDTRDYIYDMDTKTQDIDLQSAEAYVNSEYAVALTELEV